MTFKIIRFLLIVGIFFSCGSGDGSQEDDFSGTDYRLFKRTPIWELAKAVQEQNTNMINKLIVDKKQDLNYQEPKYGSTLLMLTILNNHFRSFETLLELGADINIYDSYNGSSAVIYAADVDEIAGVNFLNSLIQKGANPNDVQDGPRRKGNNSRLSALLAACQDVTDSSNPMANVKILVDAGGNVNYRNEFGASALREAAVFYHYDVVLYLLEKGAEINTIFYVHNGRKKFLWDQLRVSLFPIESDKYEQKMKVVEYLLKQGIDYRKLPIPEYAIEQAKKMYPNTWEDYLKKY